MNRNSTSVSTNNDDEEYYVYPTLPGSNYTEHDEDHLFCDDPSCPCHEDEENMGQLQNWYNNGEIGSVDGDLIYRGRTI
jgi:hypothetical protein